MQPLQSTLQNFSDTGPSFSEAVNSCTTFSSPLLMACISSARYFNCICMVIKLLATKTCYTENEPFHKNNTQKMKQKKNTFVEASKFTKSLWKSRSSGNFSASTYSLPSRNWLQRDTYKFPWTEACKSSKFFYFHQTKNSKIRPTWCGQNGGKRWTSKIYPGISQVLSKHLQLAKQKLIIKRYMQISLNGSMQKSQIFLFS